MSRPAVPALNGPRQLNQLVIYEENCGKPNAYFLDIEYHNLVSNAYRRRSEHSNHELWHIFTSFEAIDQIFSPENSTNVLYLCGGSGSGTDTPQAVVDRRNLYCS